MTPRELLAPLASRASSLGGLALNQLGTFSRSAPHFRGRGRAQRLLTRAVESAGVEIRDVEVVIDGLRWTLDLRELIQFRLFWDGAHDGHVRNFLVREASRLPRCVLWDVGANIGAVALPLCRRLPHLRVEAFEPSPMVFEKLLRHRQDNPGLDLGVHQVALADHDGTTAFFASSEVGNGGLGSLAKAHNTVSTPVEVRVARGDALISAGEIEAPDLIKIDVEGFEPECLDGLAETLRKKRPVLCVESSSYRLSARGLAKDAIAKKLEALGYAVSVITEEGERPLRASDFDTNFDLAAR